MRSIREIRFRLWQQVENLRLFCLPPAFSPKMRVAELPLPHGPTVADSLRESLYAEGVQRIADEIIRHRFPLFDFHVETGPEIRWRKDYINGPETGTDYFRFIPYLDFAKAGDHKVVWELNRHQHLVLLAQAWLLSGNSEYLTEIESELESWFTQNPFLRGINYASALEVAFRALSWLWIDHWVGAVLSDSIRRKLLNGLFQHGYFLQANLSTYFSPNTHLLGEGVALYALGLKFPDAKWKALGGRILAEERDRQIQRDGSHFEQSTYYHVYALDFFLLYYLLAQRPSNFEEPLCRMAKFLATVNGPAALLSFFGDDDGGRLFHPYGNRTEFGRATLATCARLFPDAMLPLIPNTLPEQAAWWLGPESVATTQQPSDSVRHFPDSGLVSIVRGKVHVLIDTGPFGPGGAGHSHSDTLSLTVRVGERELLIDPGTFTYVADPRARDEFRGSGFHNTIRVDGRDQADPTRPFRWENKPTVNPASLHEDGDIVAVEGVCQYRGVTHRRHCTLMGSELLAVTDQLSGPKGEHTFEQFWHGPATVLSNAPARSEVVEGWRSPCLGSKERCPVTVYRWRGSFPVTVFSLVLITQEQS